MRISELYSLETQRENKYEELWELCRTLLDLHAIADETMRGVGTLFSPRVSFEQSGEPVPAGIELLHFRANLLLTLRGSLSRIGKHRGIILPKMRTAETGLTLRSLSCHLSFHSSEVNVSWRAVPWVNIHEGAVNALIVPWPYKIEPGAFRKAGGTATTSYFSYSPSARINPSEILGFVLGAKENVDSIHLLIFPESALTPQELDQLQSIMEKHLLPHEMPVILTGVRVPERTAADGGAMGTNRAVLSAYYAGKWYEMFQDKHHPWRLDGAQIKTYRLFGKLVPTQVYWEAIRIPRRQLSFLASRSWLSITPLICEDLARLDPVSNLIRGVGPTLVVALLLDGPQIKGRWPDRYTSILADDPGTSVLTVTSLGMANLSNPDVPKEELNAAKGVIGSWREPTIGQNVGVRKEIKYDESGELFLPMLTIASQVSPCKSVDMRCQHDSSVFRFQEIAGTHLKEPAPQERAPGNDTVDETSHQNSDVAIASDAQKRADMIELSLYAFFVDALVDVPSGTEDDLLNWMRNAVGIGLNSEIFDHQKLAQANQEILQLLRWTRLRSSIPEEIPTPQFLFGIATVTSLVKHARGAGDAAYVDPLDILANTAIAELEKCVEQLDSGTFAEMINIEELRHRYVLEAAAAHADWPEDERAREQRLSCRDIARLKMAASQSVLWAIHNRLLAKKGEVFDKVARKLQGDFNKSYLRWAEAHQKRKYRVEGNAKCPLCALPPTQIRYEL